jgi:hypothetical protein
LSANAFNRARGSLDFGRKPDDTDRDYALSLACGLLLYFENQRADAQRADALSVRFEDLIAARRATVERLNEWLGLAMAPDDAKDADFLPIHRTTATPEEAIDRWRREAIAPDARAVLESHLFDAMTFNGYELPPGSRPAATFDFSQCSSDSPHGIVAAAPHRGLSVTITGEDFWIGLPADRLNARDLVEIWACVRGDCGMESTLYWCRANEIFDEGRSIHIPFHPAGHWQIVRFPLTEHPHWHGRIVQLRLDVFNGRGAGGHGEIAWVRAIDRV